MTRAEQLDAMTEADKMADLRASIRAHGCVRLTTRQAVAFWGAAVDALVAAKEITATFVEHYEDQCSEIVLKSHEGGAQ